MMNGTGGRGANWRGGSGGGVYGPTEEGSEDGDHDRDGMDDPGE